MILSNVAIADALKEGRLIIDPPPGSLSGDLPGKSPFNTSAVDLRLGNLLQVPKEGLAVAIDLRRGNVPTTLATITDTHDLSEKGPYTLEPNRLVLGQTLEHVSLPLPPAFQTTAPGKPALAARIEGKSSFARFGLLVHFTAPTIHAGWAGKITLEIMNLGPTSILLSSGIPICQLILEEVLDEPKSNPSQFHGQRTPAGQ